MRQGNAADHPRVCGEQSIPTRLTAAATGSSPRVRGTGFRLRLSVSFRRIIPACAGNRNSTWRRGWTGSDHPRVCGEQTRAADTTAPNTGSSPRVRGTETDRPGFRALNRIIPACAGNRTTRPPLRSSPSDHPRVCGEQDMPACSRILHGGSSPRVRGTVDPFPAYGEIVRIIPACAGNRRKLGQAGSGVSDHPRVCGEQRCGPPGAATTSGSSPRVRGTVCAPGVLRRAHRIIPACAGNRLPGAAPADERADHPRVCGEQKRTTGWVQVVDGSSPRVRGTGPPRFLMAYQ